MLVSLTTICHISPLCHSFIANLLHYSWDCLIPQQHKKMLEQTCITYNESCIIIHQNLENIETSSSRPRPRLFLQDQDQDQDFYFKTKTIFMSSRCLETKTKVSRLHP